MDQIQCMRIFLRIAQTHSFTRAAEDLALPRATVSNAIKWLEQRLGVRLLLRTTRQVTITEEGEAYYQCCKHLLEQLEETNHLFVKQRQQPSGHVTVDMPHSLARLRVIPALADFQTRYPQITLTIRANDHTVDLLEQGVDCVLRAWPAENNHLRARKVAELVQLTCASPAYLARYGTPQHPDQLAAHYTVGYAPWQQQANNQLQFLVCGKIKTVSLASTLNVSGADAYIAAAKAGFGLIQASQLSLQEALDKQQLVPILSQWAVPSMPFYLMYTQGYLLAPRIRVFMDWLIELLASPTFSDPTHHAG
jgi:DNA-binding transcriptional LysR family regulator